MRHVLAALKGAPPRLFIYTSSTSVYAQTDGGWVDEESLTHPPHENGKRLLQAEQLLRQAGEGCFKAVILRLSGIYGPERHALLDKIRGGAKILPGDGNRWINQVHRDDVVGAICFLMKSKIQNPKSKIFNLSDDYPVLQRDYVNWVSQQLGRPPPHFAPEAQTAKTAGRQGFQPNRRISNKTLRKLGWAPRHPTFQDGLNYIRPSASS